MTCEDIYFPSITRGFVTEKRKVMICTPHPILILLRRRQRLCWLTADVTALLGTGV